MSSTAWTIVAIPFDEKVARVASFLSSAISCVVKTGFSCLVSDTCSLATHDNSSLSSHDILYAFIITGIFFSVDVFSILWNSVLQQKEWVCSAIHVYSDTLVPPYGRLLKETVKPHQIRNMPHAPAMISMGIPDPVSIELYLLFARDVGDDHGRDL